jgi:hypothetical protein
MLGPSIDHLYRLLPLCVLGEFYNLFCVVYCESIGTLIFTCCGTATLIVVASRREMPRLLSAVRIIRRPRPRLLYYHLSLYFSFLRRLYSNPLTTAAVSKYHIPRIVLPSLLPGRKTLCSS